MTDTIPEADLRQIAPEHLRRLVRHGRTPAVACQAAHELLRRQVARLSDALDELGRAAREARPSRVQHAAAEIAHMAEQAERVADRLLREGEYA